MGTVLSIRGTNGSGKTTVARRFLPAHGEQIELNPYPSPTKKDPERQKRAVGYLRDSVALGHVGVVGTYKTACGGMDQMPDFAVCRAAISYMLTELQCDHVIAEGLLASGVYGSWGIYAGHLRLFGHQYAFCYLSTPLEVCKERIRARQAAAGRAGKEINWQLVENKYNSVLGNRIIALEHGEIVYDLPFEGEVGALIEIMRGRGDGYRRG